MFSLIADISATDNHIIQPQLQPQETFEAAGVAPEILHEVPETGDAAMFQSPDLASVFVAPATDNAPSSSQDLRDTIDALM
jgi:hypothetical protein